jgi:hypothetical protein
MKIGQSHLLKAVLALALYFLFYLPVEFFLTEIYFLIPGVSPWVSSAALLAFLLVVVLFNMDKKIFKSKILFKFGLVLVFAGFSLYIFYRHEKLQREYLPKIYSASPVWAIQGQRITIEGANFRPNFEQGQVFFDGMELIVVDWQEKKIIAEIPVPATTGNFNLVVVRKDEALSNRYLYEIKDPDELKKYLK